MELAENKSAVPNGFPIFKNIYTIIPCGSRGEMTFTIITAL